MNITTSQKILLPIISLSVAFCMLAFQHIENSSQPIQFSPQENPVVIELFTSQSCYTCNNADAVAHKIKDYKNVILLSYHVDYWNSLGWKDIFSDSTHTDYQRMYENKLEQPSFTPQMVVNGKTQFDGTNIRLLNNSLKEKSTTEPLLSPTALRNGRAIEMFYDLDKNHNYSSAYALLLMDSFKIDINKNPYMNMTLVNPNVVLKKVPLKTSVKKGVLTFELPSMVNENNKFKVALLLQDENMTVVAASIATVQ
ncbi:DUF1223 domain-containing protein [uncultured Nonlabens sp.]|uniref:DUF1223 domain-containing protein n=1 Tax=uncultured Nonlabens sp. TaxID=859306 RepID=UPI0026132EF0|nr:DUF1223 domain-containing protein [uncultured Nonlabens sp.]